MIIPVRCFTCGKLLCDKWDFFIQQVEKEESESGTENVDKENIKGKVLTRIGLDRICCRRHLLGHVDLIDNI